MVLELINEQIRIHHLEARKLYLILKPTLIAMHIKMGRDAFFDLMREAGLLKPRKKTRRVRTTDSRHGLPVYPNRIDGLSVERPNQVWVSDLTYLTLDERVGRGSPFAYLSLVSDAYSRKILGWQVSASLEYTGTLRALEMALKTARQHEGLIHHSDRGSQYVARPYVETLRAHGVEISMCGRGQAYDNAIAERINGILKQEYHLGGVFRSLDHVEHAVREAVTLYNEKRPHRSLDMLTPQQAHQRSGPLKKHWSTRKDRAPKTGSLKDKQTVIELFIPTPLM